MPVIQLIVILAVIGLLLYLVNQYVPMDDKIKRILNVVVLIAVVIWLLNVFGLLSGLSSMRVGPRHVGMLLPLLWRRRIR